MLLWTLIEHEAAWPKLCHAESEPTAGSLTDVIRLLTDPRRLVFLVERTDTQDWAGVIWFEDIIPNLRAFANIFIRRRDWGRLARQASHLALAQAFGPLNWQAVWATTPWENARHHAESLGFQIMAWLPDLTGSAEKPLGVWMLRLRKEDWDGQDQSV